jgi:hypothetical protein
MPFDVIMREQLKLRELIKTCFPEKRLSELLEIDKTPLRALEKLQEDLRKSAQQFSSQDSLAKIKEQLVATVVLPSSGD